MLKFQLNKNNMRPDIVRISYNSIDSNEIDEFDSDKLLLTCYHDGNIEINEGDEIIASYSHVFGSDEQTYAYNQYFNVTGSDKEELFFVGLVDKYYELIPESFSFGNMDEYDEESDEYIPSRYLYVYFKNHHFFDENGDYVYVFADGGDGENELIGEVYGDRCLKFPLAEADPMNCTELTDDDDRTDCEHINVEIEQHNRFIINNLEIATAMAKYDGIEVGDDIQEYLDGLNGLSLDYSAESFRFYRYDFMFYDPSLYDRISLGVVKPSASVRIPLFSKFSTDLNQETDVRDNFTKVEVKKSINPVNDMEKDVYSPVIRKNGDNEIVTEIRFNLHFREHRGEDWKVKPDSYWNGTYNDNGQLKLMDYSNAKTYAYFSYSDKSKQSDLLSYLGFTDSDVKYRKNKLKKSFLRLSFYDSMQPTNQNLIAYSTIFIDTGNLYGKYMRNFENDDVKYSRNDDDGVVKQDLIGGRVNREPYGFAGTSDSAYIESLRLSSQFVVKDKYLSDSSSEGFYLYLWKSMETTAPSDIYMKVEFNHAGYGRTVPFMMPFNDGGIKSFENIVADWNNSGAGYDIRQYNDYSYIRLKHYYDNTTKEHYYYVDNGTYGDSIGKDGIITLNLYEAKVR